MNTLPLSAVPNEQSGIVPINHVSSRLTVVAAASLLLAVPVLFNVGFTLLGNRFDYPAILRRPTGEVLARFAHGQAELLPLWTLMMLSALLFIPLSWSTVFVVAVRRQRNLASLVGVLGVLAGLVQTIGLARWIFVVPYLALLYGTAPDAGTRQAAVVVFEALHRFLGMGIGEFLGYAFTAAWTVGLGLLLRPRYPILAGFSAPLALGIAAGMAEPFGLAFAGGINAIAYLLWSLWLIALGIALLRRPR